MKDRIANNSIENEIHILDYMNSCFPYPESEQSQMVIDFKKQVQLRISYLRELAEASSAVAAAPCPQQHPSCEAAETECQCEDLSR